jgi:hypothetical protein
VSALFGRGDRRAVVVCAVIVTEFALGALFLVGFWASLDVHRSRRFGRGRDVSIRLIFPRPSGGLETIQIRNFSRPVPSNVLASRGLMCSEFTKPRGDGGARGRQAAQWNAISLRRQNSAVSTAGRDMRRFSFGHSVEHARIRS